ncbi:hypothetical protein JYU02_00865 [bacterium AH-315-P15]|nr:hypothetical protein [bacterium AH-315-P15]
MPFEAQELIRVLMVKANEAAEDAHEAAASGQSGTLLPGDYVLCAKATRIAAERLSAYASAALELAREAGQKSAKAPQ